MASSSWLQQGRLARIQLASWAPLARQTCCSLCSACLKMFVHTCPETGLARIAVAPACIGAHAICLCYPLLLFSEGNLVRAQCKSFRYLPSMAMCRFNSSARGFEVSFLLVIANVRMVSKTCLRASREVRSNVGENHRKPLVYLTDHLVLLAFVLTCLLAPRDLCNSNCR